jgi:hypothetical protein
MSLSRVLQSVATYYKGSSPTLRQEVWVRHGFVRRAEVSPQRAHDLDVPCIRPLERLYTTVLHHIRLKISVSTLFHSLVRELRLLEQLVLHLESVAAGAVPRLLLRLLPVEDVLDEEGRATLLVLRLEVLALVPDVVHDRTARSIRGRKQSRSAAAAPDQNSSAFAPPTLSTLNARKAVSSQTGPYSYTEDNTL